MTVLTKLQEVTMLVLSRKTDEMIVIGDEVKISILSIRGKHVRLGIEAPRDVSVDREEIHARKQESRKKARNP